MSIRLLSGLRILHQCWKPDNLESNRIRAFTQTEDRAMHAKGFLMLFVSASVVGS